MNFARGSKAQVRVSFSRPFWWFLAATALLTLMMLTSLMVGPVSVSLSQAWSAIFNFDSNETSPSCGSPIAVTSNSLGGGFRVFA